MLPGAIASLICLCTDDGLQKPPHASYQYHSLQHNENEHCQCDKHQLLAASSLKCQVIMDKFKKTCFVVVVDRFYMASRLTCDST